MSVTSPYFTNKNTVASDQIEEGSPLLKKRCVEQVSATIDSIIEPSLPKSYGKCRKQKSPHPRVKKMKEIKHVHLAQQKPEVTPDKTILGLVTSFPSTSTLAPPTSTIAQSSKPAEITLSSDQQLVVNAAALGESFFYTGPAGTGKSFVLKVVTNKLKENKPPRSVFITASTGVAACNIGGTTLHSFAGVGLGTKDVNDLIKIVMQNKCARSRWKIATALVIDEVSMISGELFDKLEYIARVVRGSSQPFGGIQIILCGDFFQLPPVFSKDTTDHLLCFEAKTWKSVVPDCYQLNTIFRQKGDQTFVNLLNEVRSGVISDMTWRLLESCQRRNWSTDKELSDETSTIEATQLFPHREIVETTNNARLKQLEGEIVCYEAQDFATADNFKKLLEHDRLPAHLELKLNAQVLLLKNLDLSRELVNGSVGFVIGFASQNIEGDQLPIVQFRNGYVRTISREESSIEIGSELVAKRKQIPLTLAWALSIHKSQGMTLSKVEINLANVFAEGQAYVALSRVTSLKGLKISGDLPKGSKFQPNPKVLKFYEQIQQLL